MLTGKLIDLAYLLNYHDVFTKKIRRKKNEEAFVDVGRSDFRDWHISCLRTKSNSSDNRRNH
jgi:hypothetical protein